MKFKKIRIGVLGCANIAYRSIIPSVLELSDTFELVAVASRTENKAHQFASKFNCEAIIGYENIISREDIEALYIPLPTGLHKEWVSKALNFDKHVYVEKSLAFNFSDASYLVNLANSKNLAMMEGYMFLYHSQHEIVKNIINADGIGDIRSFSSSFGFPPLDETNFRYNQDLGGGVVFDAAGYPLRAAHFIMGDDLVVKSSSLNYSKKNNSTIYGSAFLKNSTGKSAFISFGFDNYYQCNYELWGSKGKLIVKKAFTPKSTEQPLIIIENNSGTNEIFAPKDNHFKNALLKFAELIRCGEKNVSYSDILRQSKSLESIIKLAVNE